jgi:hypothetical protein
MIKNVARKYFFKKTGRKKFENMESLDRWKWHFQSLLYLIHTNFGSFYLDIQNHIVEYPRVQGCMK